MISDHTRLLLRNAALRNNLGGNKYSNRRYYNNDEIIQLFQKYENYSNKLQSLFTNKIFKTISLWRNDLVRYLDANSARRFLLLVNKPTCKGCKEILSLNNCFISSNNYSKFCINCKNKKIWCTKEYLGQDKLKHRGNNITKSKLDFYKTHEGEIVKKIISKKNSIAMTNYYKTNAGILQKKKNSVNNSKIMKEKIRTGKFTPKITNSWTHWNAIIEIDNNVFKFRSSWEACFWYCNRHLNYETFRISYELNGNIHTYIADFYDYENNILYEIKPKSSFNDKIEKMHKIIEYCTLNNIKFLWINEDNIFNFIDESKFYGKNKLQLNKLKGIKNEKIDD